MSCLFKCRFKTAVKKHYVPRLITYLGEKKEFLQQQAFGRKGMDYGSAKAYVGLYTPLYDSDCVDKDVFVSFFLKNDDSRLFVLFSFGKSLQFADMYMSLNAKQFEY